MDHDWFDKSIGLHTKGLRKFTMHGMSIKFKAEMAFLNQMVVNGVVNMADAFDDLEFVVIHLTAWSFLSRVQSEVLPLEAGSVHELSGVLHSGRHSAVAVKQGRRSSKATSELHIRWRRRKNRPHGSYLRGICNCCDASSTQVCVVCRMLRFLTKRVLRPGQLIFPSFATRSAASLGAATQVRPQVLQQITEVLGTRTWH